jgi:hypothetical protein
LLPAVIFASCSAPDDDGGIVIPPVKCDAEWRGDTARIKTTIRFEAIVDTTLFPLRRFSGSGLRVGLVCLPPPDSANLPWVDIYSVSANYLDIPATGLPFEAEILPAYFRDFSCARLATAVIVVYRDQNENNRFDPGESVVGADEQSLYAFVQGDLNTVPPEYQFTAGGSNVLIRLDQNTIPRFRGSPDYLATIFIINVRGEQNRYHIPYPWEVSSPLFP